MCRSGQRIWCLYGAQAVLNRLIEMLSGGATADDGEVEVHRCVFRDDRQPLGVFAELKRLRNTFSMCPLQGACRKSHKPNPLDSIFDIRAQSRSVSVILLWDGEATPGTTKNGTQGMAESESDYSRWQIRLVELLSRDSKATGPARENLTEVLGRPESQAILASRSPASPNGAMYDAMRLFWGVYELWRHGQTPGGPYVPPEYETLFLEWLEDHQFSHRVPYVPDSDDVGDNYDALLIYVHISAARAFRIRRGGETSEEMLDCLTEVEQAMARLEATPGGPGLFLDEAPSIYTSGAIILAMVYVELWRVRQAEGRYVEALHYLAGAAQYYHAASVNFYDDLIDLLWPDAAMEEHCWESRLQGLLTGLHISAVEAVSTFQLIRYHSESVEDWGQVSRNCGAISDLPIHIWDFSELEDNESDRLIAVTTAESETGFNQARDDLIVLNPEITDERRGTVTWGEFWYGAKQWSSAQLSPSEYRRMRQADLTEAAERRLARYFFHGTWNSLPERAQGRLISADINWNSHQGVSRESILNDLLRTVEEMCYTYIAKPLRNTEKAAALGVRRYIEICEDPRFEDFAAQRQLEDDEVRFLTENLPAAMRQLADERNAADHVAGVSAANDIVTSAYRLFMGIGQSGILPELAQVGRKLKNTGTRDS